MMQEGAPGAYEGRTSTQFKFIHIYGLRHSGAMVKCRRRQSQIDDARSFLPD